MYTKAEVEQQKDMAREDKADRIRIDIIEWWRNEHGCGQQVDLLNNLLRGLGMKVVLVPYLVRVFYLDLLVQEIVVDAMAEEHARAQVYDAVLVEDGATVRLPFTYIGGGFAVNGRHSSLIIQADECTHNDRWTYEVTRSLNYEGIGA